MKMIFYSFVVFFSFVGCYESGQDSELLDKPNLRVNYYTVACTGEMTGECLLVQEGEAIGTDEWSYFYYKDDINGFEFEEGYVYDLVVEKTTLKNPPMDASGIQYKLLQVLAKEKVQK